MERQLLERVSLETDINIVTECMANFNPYSGKHDESMDISFSLDDIQDHMDLSLETLKFDQQSEKAGRKPAQWIVRREKEADYRSWRKGNGRPEY